MLDQSGPGTVYRIWVTLFDPTSWLRVYFDGEVSPRINILMRDLFSGTRAPFLSPLVADNTRSSGGYTCYLPLPYQRSIRITTNMSGYYNIGYHTFSPDTTVSTWTGTEDSSAARAAWRNAGTDPTGPVGATVATGLTHLAPGTPRSIFDTVGPRSISAIKLTVPGEGCGDGHRRRAGPPRAQPVPAGPRPGPQRGAAGPPDRLRGAGSAGAGAGGRRAGGGLVRPRRRPVLPVARQLLRPAARVDQRQDRGHGPGRSSCPRAHTNTCAAKDRYSDYAGSRSPRSSSCGRRVRSIATAGAGCSATPSC